MKIKAKLWSRVKGNAPPNDCQNQSEQRNKLKRWAREFYKLEENNIKKGYNLVILYKKSTRVEYTNFKKIYEDLFNNFKRLDLYEYYISENKYKI